jgi:hypothetical protein
MLLARESRRAVIHLARHSSFHHTQRFSRLCRPKDDTGLIHSSLCGFLCCSPRVRQPQKMPFANENIGEKTFGEWIKNLYARAGKLSRRHAPKNIVYRIPISFITRR